MSFIMNYKGTYPKITEDIYYKLSSKKEFLPQTLTCFRNYQLFINNFLSKTTPYDNMLIFHEVGLGKTLTELTIADNYIGGYNILFVVKNNAHMRNLKREENNTCLKEKRKAKGSVNGSDITPKSYDYITHAILSTYVKNDSRFTLNDTVIIIDEAHNMLNNMSGTMLAEVIARSKNTKVIMLTATPVTDSVKEIFELISILNNEGIPIRNETVRAGLVDEIPNNSELLQVPFYKLTKKGVEFISKTMIAKVSVAKQDITSFAIKKYNGTKLSANFPQKLKLCIMSEYQANAYEYSLNEKDSLFNKATSISDIAIPPKLTDDMLHIKNIQKYSCKFKQMLVDIENSEGICFVYTDFVETTGTKLISRILRVNGYNKYNGNKTGKGYIILNSSISDTKKIELIRECSRISNINGDYIKVIVGSPVVSEGYSFHNIRHMMIISPQWNQSSLEQILGRSTRLHSHINLPESKRVVNIYLYTAIHPNLTNKSIDLEKYKLSLNKHVYINELYSLLEKLSIDCFTKNNCYYKVNDTPSEVKVDTSTYNIVLHNPNLYNHLRESIVDIFKKYGYRYHIDNIKYAYDATNKDKVVDMEDFIYSVFSLKGETIEKDNKQFKIDYKNEYVFLKQVQVPVKNPKKQVRDMVDTPPVTPPRKVIDFTGLQQKIKGEVYGSYFNRYGEEDGEFRIIDGRKVSDKKDINKKNTLNLKTCSFIQLQDLQDIYLFLSGKKTSGNKREVCKIIEEYLQKTQKIVEFK